MFGKLKARIAALEAKMRKREIVENCNVGKHKWELVQQNTSCGYDKKPWIRCIHCYGRPE